MAIPIRACWPLVCAFGFSGFLVPAVLAQQTATTRITFNLANAEPAADWPVAVTQVAIGGRAIRPGQPIAVSGKWLGTTVVTLRNVSPKSIVQVGMDLTFPESGNGSPNNPFEAAWSSLGLVPNVVYTDRNGQFHAPPSFGAQPAPIRIAPGAYFHLPFSKDGDTVQATLAKKGVPITKASLAFTTIYFADDSRWSAGVYYLAPHPAGGAWTRVTKEQFFSGTRRAH